MTSINPLTVPTKRLQSSITATGLTFTLSDILGWSGSALVSSDFGAVAYAIFRNATNTQIEIMQFDPATIAGSSITISKRGLNYNGDLTTESSTRKYAWTKGTYVELGTHFPQLFKSLVDIYSVQSIAGVKTFTSLPVIPITPSASTDAASKAYVDLVAGGSANYDQNIIAGIAGETIASGNVVYFKTSDQRWWKADSSTASTSANVRLGIAQAAGVAAGSLNVLIGGLDKKQSGLTAGSSYYLSTAGALSTTRGANIRFIGEAVSTTTIFWGANDDVENLTVDGSRIYVVDTGTANVYVMTLVPTISAYKTGQIFSFKAVNANTTTSTLNVNGLGVKTIKKVGGGTDLVANDILAGQIVMVEYDGTNFQMINPTGNATLTSSVLKFGGTGADGALAVSSGTTTIDLAGVKYVVKNYTSISITGTGVVNFINPHATGSFILFRSQGAVTLTSSATPMLNASALGAPGGASVTATVNTAGNNGNDGLITTLTSNKGIGDTITGITAGGAAISSYTVNNFIGAGIDLAFLPYWTHVFVGAGAGSGAVQTNVGGSHTSGAGGRGGGCLIIECAGAWNFTTASGISVAGVAGGAATCATRDAGGGGGGGGGCFLAIYDTLTSNVGTVNVAGGTGGAKCGTFSGNTTSGSGGGSDQVGSSGNAGGPGGAGAPGRSLITPNTLFV